MAKMNRSMTTFANRNYIELVFFRITHVMMIYLCSNIAIRTIINRGVRYFSSSDSITKILGNIAFMFVFFVPLFPMCQKEIFSFFCLHPFYMNLLPMFAIDVFASCRPSNFAFIISRNTLFTITSAFRFSYFAGIIFRDGLNFLAFRALFCLNWFRHFFFLNKKLCLEPFGSYILPCGSLYYNNSFGGVKLF